MLQRGHASALGVREPAGADGVLFGLLVIQHDKSGAGRDAQQVLGLINQVAVGGVVEVVDAADETRHVVDIARDDTADREARRSAHEL